MSSALQPILSSAGAQSSTPNSSPPNNKSLTSSQGMAQHIGPPGPYATGLGHVPSLSHTHSNMGLSNSNISTNITMNTVANMSHNQMTPHSGMNQASSHNIQGVHSAPIKSSTLTPPAVTQTVSHPYINPSNSRDDEGTTLPASQNSAQLMAVHRAQQQQQQHQQSQQMQQQPQHHFDQTPQQQSHMSPDKYKTQNNPQIQTNPTQFQQLHQIPQIPQMIQPPPEQQQQQSPQQQQQDQQLQQQNQHQSPIQSNGTATESLEETCNNVATVTPTQSTVDLKNEMPSSTPAVVQNHIPSSTNDVDKKESEHESTSVKTVTTSPQTQTSTTAEQQTLSASVSTETTAEPAVQISETSSKITNTSKDVSKQSSTLKLATTPRAPTRKRETKVSKSPESVKTNSTKTNDERNTDSQNSRPSDKAKSPRTPSEERRSKRTRTRTQPYQSPLPELALISKLSSNSTTTTKAPDDKLIVFYKYEFLAVRNAEGGFYVCQAVQNVYKSSLRIRIRWLSQDKQEKIYIPDFYDVTDFDCILTNLNMERIDKGKYNLPKEEFERTKNILKRALAVEKGEEDAPSLTEEHPDGLDLSLFRDESQLKKKRKTTKRKALEPLSSDNEITKKRMKRLSHKTRAKRTKSAATKTSLRKNNQNLEKRSNTYSVIEKKESVNKTRSGRAERAKRRGEATSNLATKTSPVVDQKKARVLAKVALKTAIPASTQNKKKGGRNTPTTSGSKTSSSNAATTSKTGLKTSTRSSTTLASAVATTSSALLASTASTSTSTSSSTSTATSRRGKKTKK